MKKLLPAAAAFILIAAVTFTACGKKSESDEKSTTESTTKSTTNLSQAADEFADDMKTTIDDLKSDVSEMMPSGNVTTSETSENTAEAD